MLEGLVSHSSGMSFSIKVQTLSKIINYGLITKQLMTSKRCIKGFLWCSYKCSSFSVLLSRGCQCSMYLPLAVPWAGLWYVIVAY